MTYFQCGPLMTCGGLEWEVESTTVTHSSADWWDILLPLAETPDRRDRRLLLSHPKDSGKRGKRNCQSSEQKSFYRSGTRTIDRPVAGRYPNPLGHRSPLIHTNVFVLFLMSLISCWAVAASLVAEETNAGMTVFIADITSMCGLRSDGIVVLLSACSLVRCCSHQYIFPCLEMLCQGTPPLCAASCMALPGHGVEVHLLGLCLGWKGQ